MSILCTLFLFATIDRLFVGLIFLSCFLIIDKAFALKEVLFATLLGIVSDEILLRVQVRLLSVVLDVDLIILLVQINVLLQTADKTDELWAFDLLRIEIISFGYIKVRNKVFRRL